MSTIPTLERLQQLLKDTRNKPGDGRALELFLTAGLEYFVQGNAKCWWCTPETRPAATEMFILFSLEQNKAITDYKNALTHQLLSCTSCIKAYYRSKSEVIERYKRYYDPERVALFSKTVEEWDTNRMAEALTRFTEPGNRSHYSGRSVLLEALYDSRTLLVHKTVAEATSKYIRSKLDSEDMFSMGNVLLPGFITLCFSTDALIRQWAWRSIKFATNKNVEVPAASMVPIFAGVLDQVAVLVDERKTQTALLKNAVEWVDEVTFEFCLEDVWRGLRVSLGRLPTKTKETIVDALDGVSVIVCKSLLDIEDADFIDALRTFAEVIGAADRAEIWPRIEKDMGYTATDLVRFILDHQDIRGQFRRKLANSDILSAASVETHHRILRPVLEWITPFVASLVLPHDLPALIELVNSLMFRLRQSLDTSIVQSVLTVHMAIAIIKHCFKLPTVEKFSDGGTFVLAEFLNKHVGFIVDIAQGKDPLSGSDMLTTRSGELIDTMLREDLDVTYTAFQQIGEIAQSMRTDPDSLDSGVIDSSNIPTLIQFRPLWLAVLQYPYSTAIVNKALFAASYLLLFDPLPPDMVRYLPEPWQRAYANFERERERIADTTRQMLLILADTMDTFDFDTRLDFERESLSVLLRCLVSPFKSLHAVVLRILRVDILDSDVGGGGDNEEDAGWQGSGRSIASLSDTQRDLVCYELFSIHHESFVNAMAGIADDCKILVTFNRPAYSCGTNIALIARSIISAASGLIDSGSSEAMARLFFGLCGLLGAILKASSETTIQIKDRSIYMDCVADMFRTVFKMLNAVEFSSFVHLVKASNRLNETQTIDALSTCLAQMLTYLKGRDELDAARGIVKMFGLVASGLADAPGTSMLYPVESVHDLVDGTTGSLSTELRRLLKTITSQKVWEPRSVAISKNRPVQIIIDDDDEALAAIDEDDLSAMLDSLDDEASGQLYVSKPVAAIPKPVPEIPASSDVSRGISSLSVADNSAKPSSSAQNKHAVTGFWSSIGEVQQPVRRTQTSVDRWFGKATAGGSQQDSLTSRLAQRKAETKTHGALQTGALVSGKNKKSSASSGSSSSTSRLKQLRSDFVKDRQAVAARTSRAALTAVPKQIVQAPRAMATVPADVWAADRLGQPSEPPKPMYVRDASKAALAEMERVKNRSARMHVDSGESDISMSSSDEDEEEEGSGDTGTRSSGLKGLLKFTEPTRMIKMIAMPGQYARGKAGTASGGMFFDQQARDRAVAERKAKARLLPSMSLLHSQVLAWTYEDSADMPPQLQGTSMLRIPDSFDDCAQYTKVLQPLLLLESWAQFQRAKEESWGNELGEAVLETRMSVDAFQDITFNMSLADMDGMAENDVVVFAECIDRTKRPFLGSAAAGGVQSGKRDLTGRKTFLALVRSRTFKRDSGQVVVRVHLAGTRLATMTQLLVLNSTWQFFKLFSITPVHREYAALMSLPYLNEQLVQEILQPCGAGAGQALARAEVMECMRVHALNQPQAEAVVAAMQRKHGFTLIQGPPGTGKTKTILGLAGALLCENKRTNQDDDVCVVEDGAQPRRNKLLICAPSNAAVDEIVKRLKCGIRDRQGNTFFPRVVRVGQSDSISSTVRDTTLDFLLDAALNAYNGTSDKSNIGDRDISDSQSSLLFEIAGRSRREGKAATQAAVAKEDRRTAVESQQALRRQVGEIDQEIRSLEDAGGHLDPSDLAQVRANQQSVRAAYDRRRKLYQKLDDERNRARTAAQTMDLMKHKVRMQILQGTDILCCTLSGSGHELMTSLNCTFETVIIDEAAQSIELSCLIPLKYDCERCILVGDPNQLPPTVLSLSAAKLMYNQSMFVRIQKNAPEAVSLLSIQYRMHPEISVFPSRLFYASRLRDGPEMDKKQSAPWHASANFPPFAFFNIMAGREEAGRSHSVFNMAEVDAATQLVLSLCLNYPKLPWRQRIGIITPYKQQLRKLVEKFKQVFGERVTDAIEFNTVDGFQGQEKDVIIFSCVRAGGQGVGFLADERRMNVGLTRARKSLFVLGNAELLTVSPLWKQLVEESKARRLLKDTRLPLFGCRAPPGSKAPNLFQHVDSTAADGEGDRAEFTMETIDDAALDRRNTAVVEKAKAPSAASAASSVVSGAAPVVDRSQMSASEVAKEKRMLLAKTHEGTSAAPATVVVRPRQQSSLFINRRKAVGRGGGGGNTVRTPSCDSASEEADRRRHAAAEPSSMQQKASQAPSMPSCGRPPQALPGLQLVTEQSLQVTTGPDLSSRLSPTPYSASAASPLPPSSTHYSVPTVGPPPIAGPPPPPPLSANLPVLPPLPPDVSAQSQKVNYKRDKSREGRSRSPRRDSSRVPGERRGRGDHSPGRTRDQNGGRSRSRSKDHPGKEKQNRNRNRDRAGKHGRDSDSPRDHSAGPDTPKPKKRQKRVGSLFRPSASVAKSMGRRPHKNDQPTRDDIITDMLDKRR